MYCSSEFFNKLIYRQDKKGGVHKLGNVRQVVLHPSRAQVVGLMVKQPDLAYAVKRPAVFVAFDSLAPFEKGYLVDPEQKFAFDHKAAKRLGVDLDLCIIWEGLPCCTAGGAALGEVTDVEFSAETLRVAQICVAEGAADAALNGVRRVPRQLVLGFQAGDAGAGAGEVARDVVDADGSPVAGCIVVDDAALALPCEGGAAEAAGRHLAETGAALGQVGDAVGAAAVEGAGAVARAAGQTVAAGSRVAAEAGTAATTKGARAVGKQLGRAGNMFSNFKKAYDKASK